MGVEKQGSIEVGSRKTCAGNRAFGRYSSRGQVVVWKRLGWSEGAFGGNIAAGVEEIGGRKSCAGEIAFGGYSRRLLYT